MIFSSRVSPVRLFLIAGLLAGIVLSSTGCITKLKARDSLNKGVQAFKANKYDEATDFFKTAVELDPSFPTARLYLATAYMSRYIPGADSPDNMRNANAALEQFQKVLSDHPEDKDSAKLATQSIASLFFQQKKWDQAEEWNKKVIEVDPNNKDAYYTLGVIAWTRWIVPDREARAKMKMTPDESGPLKDKAMRAELAATWGPILDKGIEYERKALEIDPEYDDAMAYLNLLIRYRADLADSPQAYKKATDEADVWMNKAMDMKKLKAEKKSELDAKGGAVKK